MNALPTCPSGGGPVSISHDEGASTDVMGKVVDSKAWMTEVNGSRGGPWKENPKMASRMWSVVGRAAEKSAVKGICRFSSWVVRRWRLKKGAVQLRVERERGKKGGKETRRSRWRGLRKRVGVGGTMMMMMMGGNRPRKCLVLSAWGRILWACNRSKRGAGRRRGHRLLN